VAGAGADEQGRCAVHDQASCVVACCFCQGDIPAQYLLIHAEFFSETEQTVQHVLPLRCLNAMVGEQPLQLAGSFEVEAETDSGRDQRRQYAGAQRQLHVQQRIEATPAHGRTQRAVGARQIVLVENDEVHLGNLRHDLGFDLADDPGEAGIRPGTLQSTQHRQHVEGIADRREPQDADGVGRGIGNGHEHALRDH
jgi:hypothetical protein